MDPAIQIIDPAGKINSSTPWFESHEDLSNQYLKVIAILGSQGSGRSTLANALFLADFDVGSRGKVGRATTKGVVAGIYKDDPKVCLLDVEGADARDRGKQGKIFRKRCVNFVLGTCDAILVNVWSHDAGRVDSVGHSLLRSIFEEATAKIIDQEPRRTVLGFVLRDVEDGDEDRALTTLIQKDVEEIWEEVTLNAGLPAGDVPFDDHFKMAVVSLPHIRHEKHAFDQKIQALRQRLLSGDLDKEEFSGKIEADGFPMYAASVWDAQAFSGDGGGDPGASARAEDEEDNVYSGEDFAIVAAYKCDEVFSDLLTQASKEVDSLLTEVEGRHKIANLGLKCERIMTSCMQQYESETAEFAEEPVQARKQRELEAIVDTGLLAVYMKQIQLVREDAVAAFKAQLSDEMPDELALFTAHSQFMQAARDAKRPHSTWSCEAEEADLHNMMSELSQQHRKLLNTKMIASQNSAKAMQFLQMQHAQVQAIRQQALGGALGQWNACAVYRPPDTNVNITLGYRQGRTNLQVSMVPDDSASLLGPSGFTSGVGPANMGLSFNINM